MLKQGTRVKKVPCKILIVAPFGPEWKWVSSYFDAENYQWTFHTKPVLEGGRKALIILALQAVKKIRINDIVIVHGPWLTLFVSLVMRLLLIKKPILSFTFNHGNGIFFSGLPLMLAKKSLSNVDFFVTHSSFERKLLSEKYNIPFENIGFTHWAIRPPKSGRSLVEYLPPGKPFVCCIGRNNRDISTFLKAIEKTGVHAVLICGAGQVSQFDVPSHVQVRCDVTSAECEEVMEKALATIVPLIDESTGAGHMTVVSSLHYGTPVIGTEGPILSDYLIENVTGLSVPFGSSDAIAKAILKLLADTDFRDRLTSSSVAFAVKHLSEKSAADYLGFVLDKHIGGRHD